MITDEQVTIIGKVSKTHGVKGELSMAFDVDVDIDELKCLIFNIDGILVPFFAESSRERGTGAKLVKLHGVDNEVQASEFVGKDIYVLKDDIDDEQEEDDEDGFYLEDLIGYDLFDTDGTRVGKITDFDDSTENVLFKVENNQGMEILVPAADELFAEIDPENAKVVMDLPVGLV